MKKLIALMLTLLCVFSIVGCNNVNKDLKKQFPEYYDLDTFKGVEVYVWQTADGEYRCGVLSGTNRGKTFEEISNLSKNSATIEEMRIILASYDIPKEDIIIIPIIITASNFEIISADFSKIKDIFWGTNENSNKLIENNEIVTTALEHCKTNYDFIDTTYDSVNEKWIVEFWESGAKLPAQRVFLDKNGNVINVWFAE